ncbi:hypothetical protein [Bradyrhizobium sp. ISRA463]|uniref:hypothetical protein n=1 Tax=Bradyrhizobium sp. ISRA463 TaxID=2866199 RepID=UPI002478CAA4|nr:hypothetical protein [Bradyrhizobium sp. ISRA463]WGS23373.1 hypothetical protein MTX22_18160 [Bradyrhizobium sp. ISRA463]
MQRPREGQRRKIVRICPPERCQPVKLRENQQVERPVTAAAEPERANPDIGKRDAGGQGALGEVGGVEIVAESARHRGRGRHQRFNRSVALRHARFENGQLIRTRSRVLLCHRLPIEPRGKALRHLQFGYRSLCLVHTVPVGR